ncbi:MAG TPA: ferredoxin, partial [Phycisphaerae bacterium]|nr:ferredoxin [Phycisphaerae bacterium]
MAVTKVWLEQSDCISCEACESNCPEVFSMGDGECKIKDEANDPAYLAPLSDKIQEA